MALEQRDLVRELPPLLERDDGERAAAARLPVDGEVLWVDLYSANARSHLSCRSIVPRVSGLSRGKGRVVRDGSVRIVVEVGS